jgi:hypothetical protein
VICTSYRELNTSGKFGGWARTRLVCQRRHRYFNAFYTCIYSFRFTLQHFARIMRALVYRLARSPNLTSQNLYSPRSSPLVSNLVHVRGFYPSPIMASPAKRKAEKDVSPPKTKKAKTVIPSYHLTPSRQDESGEIIWPARKEQIDRAREIIREWYVHVCSRCENMYTNFLQC